MKYKNDELNLVYGLCNTASEVDNRYLLLTRQTGTTTLMMNAVARSSYRKKVAVFFSNESIGNSFRDKIQWMGCNEKNIKCVVISNRNATNIVDMISCIRGCSFDDIYIDKSVWDLLYANQCKELEKFRAIFRKPEKTAIEKVKEIEEMFASEASEYVIMQEIKYMFGVKK